MHATAPSSSSRIVDAHAAASARRSGATERRLAVPYAFRAGSHPAGARQCDQRSVGRCCRAPRSASAACRSDGVPVQLPELAQPVVVGAQAPAASGPRRLAARPKPQSQTALTGCRPRAARAARLTGCSCSSICISFMQLRICAPSRPCRQCNRGCRGRQPPRARRGRTRSSSRVPTSQRSASRALSEQPRSAKCRVERGRRSHAPPRRRQRRTGDGASRR